MTRDLRLPTTYLKLLKIPYWWSLKVDLYKNYLHENYDHILPSTMNKEKGLIYKSLRLTFGWTEVGIRNVYTPVFDL